MSLAFSIENWFNKLYVFRRIDHICCINIPSLCELNGSKIQINVAMCYEVKLYFLSCQIAARIAILAIVLILHPTSYSENDKRKRDCTFCSEMLEYTLAHILQRYNRNWTWKYITVHAHTNTENHLSAKPLRYLKTYKFSLNRKYTHFQNIVKVIYTRTQNKIVFEKTEIPTLKCVVVI